MSELEKIIANLGYPVGMGMAPSPADLARMKDAIIEECARLVESGDWHKDYTADPTSRQLLNITKAALDNLDNCETECERLRSALKNKSRKGRNTVIEECARVAASFGKRFEYAPHIAAAIRALKDKP